MRAVESKVKHFFSKKLVIRVKTKVINILFLMSLVLVQVKSL